MPLMRISLIAKDQFAENSRTGYQAPEFIITREQRT
jgi:hypothetical protein